MPYTLIFAINEILILTYRDFLEIRIVLLSSDAVIKVNENAVFVTEELSNRETANLRDFYIQFLHYLEMVSN